MWTNLVADIAEEFDGSHRLAEAQEEWCARKIAKANENKRWQYRCRAECERQRARDRYTKLRVDPVKYAAFRKRRRDWYSRFRERERARNRLAAAKWYQRNRATACERMRNYKTANPERVRATQRASALRCRKKRSW